MTVLPRDPPLAGSGLVLVFCGVPPLSFGHFHRKRGQTVGRPGHPLRSLRSASPSLCERDGRPLGSPVYELLGFPVGELVGEGEGLGLAAGVR